MQFKFLLLAAVAPLAMAAPMPAAQADPFDMSMIFSLVKTALPVIESILKAVTTKVKRDDVSAVQGVVLDILKRDDINNMIKRDDLATLGNVVATIYKREIDDSAQAPVMLTI